MRGCTGTERGGREVDISVVGAVIITIVIIVIIIVVVVEEKIAGRDEGGIVKTSISVGRSEIHRSGRWRHRKVDGGACEILEGSFTISRCVKHIATKISIGGVKRTSRRAAQSIGLVGQFRRKNIRRIVRKHLGWIIKPIGTTTCRLKWRVQRERVVCRSIP